MKESTKEELSQYNGKNGNSIFIAIKEKYIMYQPVFFGKLEPIKSFIKPVQIYQTPYPKLHTTKRL